MNSFFRKRVGATSTLFVVLTLSISAWGVKSETHLDIIEKARNLILQKDRQQALLILSKALQKEQKPQSVIELRLALSEIGHAFISDKAQQNYESSIAQRRADLNHATESISEASKIEPENFSVLSEKARILIAKGDCKAAEDVLLKSDQFFDHDEELRLTFAQTLACQKKWLEVQKIAERQLKKKNELSPYWISLETQRLIDQKNYVRAAESINTLVKIGSKYPEIDYLKWKLSIELKKRFPPHAQKYLMVCKNISANQYRQYMMDPNLCRQVNEVDTDLKGLSSATE